MTIHLNEQELKIQKKLREIKKTSGSHSPSPMMLSGIKDFKIKHDFCYFYNPYATDLFLKYFKKDSRRKDFLRELIEWYPSQNQALSRGFAPVLGVKAENLFLGNGATEIIQAVMQHFVKQKILIPIPTFSSYVEFAPKGVSVIFHQLKKESGFRLNIQDF